MNTGEALVALGARPEQGEGMVSGDVMNTGARLQAAAPPGGVLVGEATYRATERVIDYREAAADRGEGQVRAAVGLGRGRAAGELRDRPVRDGRGAAGRAATASWTCWQAR